MREVAEIAIGDEVAVQVGPRACGGIDGGVDGVQQLRDVDVGLRDIPPQRHLERRPPVAEEVVGTAQSWIQVFPVRDVVDLAETMRANPLIRKRGRGLDACIASVEIRIRRARQILGGVEADEAVEPQPERERQPFQFPLILGVDAEVVTPVQFEVRRRALGEADRDATAERVTHVRIREDELVGRELFRLNTGFEGVGAGHVGR